MSDIIPEPKTKAGAVTRPPHPCTATDCDCEFDPYEPADHLDDEESWHFRRTCAHCGHVWYSLHCPHDGVQNPCGRCGRRPTPVPVR